MTPGPTTSLPSVCADCGSVYQRDQSGASCPDCKPPRDVTPATIARERRRGKTAARGYGSRWQALSKRARDVQPFCSDCGRPDDLTTDHSPAAWARHDAGLPIRLEDIDVTCRRCNSERGEARDGDSGRHLTFTDHAERLDDLTDDMPDDLDQQVARGEVD